MGAQGAAEGTNGLGPPAHRGRTDGFAKGLVWVVLGLLLEKAALPAKDEGCYPFYIEINVF